MNTCHNYVCKYRRMSAKWSCRRHTTPDLCCTDFITEAQAKTPEHREFPKPEVIRHNGRLLFKDVIDMIKPTKA
jgi:hypothetical protein